MVVIVPLPPLTEIENLWRTISSSASHSFFISWPWIRTWLSCLPARMNPQLMTIVDAGATIAAAILVRRAFLRRGLIFTRTWILNASGHPDLDQIWIEHNGLLVSQKNAKRAWKLLTDSFIRDRNDWDEIRLNA